MLLLAPLLGLLPHATLAAVVIVYSVGLIQPMEFIAIRKVRTMEFLWAIVACSRGAAVWHAARHRGSDHCIPDWTSKPGRSSEHVRHPPQTRGRRAATLVT